MKAAPRLILAAVLVIWAPLRVCAQEESYPTKPIHMIVPFPAGGPSDIVARLIGQRMNEDWKQPVLIENRPGANTIIGAQAAAKAPPDGYTLFMAIDSTLVMNQYLYKSLPYDPLNDFAPISLTAKTVSVLAVSNASGLLTVRDLIARAKAQPGKLNYGGGTITARLMGHLFHRAAGLDIVYVPFKGTPDTLNGLLTGSVELIYAAYPIVAPVVANGAVHALARLDRDAPPSMATIPPLAEAAGIADLDDISVWLGLVAPSGTPKPIIEKIHAEIARIFSDPVLRERLEQSGSYPVTSTPEEFAAFIRKEAQRWSRVIQDIGLKLGACHEYSCPCADRGFAAADGNGWRAGSARRLSQPLDQDRRAFPGGRAFRCARPHDRAEDERGLESAYRGREQAGRQYGCCRPAGRKGGTRWLHAADGDRFHTRHEPVSLSHAALRSVE
jgi:tripartite-type tricarboxylate transporter receptor subunit TctC